MAANHAAWQMEKCGHPFKIAEAPMPVPTAHEVTIRVRAVAFAPGDRAIQTMGIILKDYPAILGCDCAGEVMAIGSAVTKCKVGDRVLGTVDHLTAGEVNNRGKGSFQHYCNVRDVLVAKLPDGIEFKDPCVLPMGLGTAGVSLFRGECLGIPYPQINPKPIGKVLLIWGGSSSVGSCGIQLAKAAGLEVAATCSAHNFAYCRSLGADRVFDYKSETIVEDLVVELKGRAFAGVFDAIPDPETFIKSAEIANRLGGKQMVATVLPPAMPYNKPLPGGVEIAYSKYQTSLSLRLYDLVSMLMKSI